MTMTTTDEDQFRVLLQKLGPEGFAQVIKSSPEAFKAVVESMNRELKQKAQIPHFEWNSNLGVFKAVLKIVEAEGPMLEKAILKRLQDMSLVKPTATLDSYGYVYPETGIFFEDEDKISLTAFGKQLAKQCTKEIELTDLEIVIFRGLQQQSAGYTFLSIVGRKNEEGILREDLLKEMSAAYGQGNGTYYANYYTTIFKQLKLLKRGTDKGKARYWLTVPEAWLTQPPSSPAIEE